jgi:uncharacterized small protein (TIGR04563 family)
MLEEIQREATRQDRSLSWIVQQAWKVARSDIRKMPSVNDVLAPAPKPVAAVAPAPAPSPVTDGEPKP